MSKFCERFRDRFYKVRLVNYDVFLNDFVIFFVQSKQKLCRAAEFYGDCDWLSAYY